jgi:sulfur carrier protein
MSRRFDEGDQKAEVSASPTPERSISVELNGNPTELEGGATVADAVDATTGSGEHRGVAVAVDGEVVPRSAWEATTLEEGQQVEVLRASQGG